MANKRTKADKQQRQADHLEKKSEARPAQAEKREAREDFSQAVTRIVRESTQDK